MQDFSEFGYPQSQGSNSAHNDSNRRQIINNLIRQRKVGEIPPVYPNGWFAILESKELVKQKTVEINVLGQILGLNLYYLLYFFYRFIFACNFCSFYLYFCRTNLSGMARRKWSCLHS